MLVEQKGARSRSATVDLDPSDLSETARVVFQGLWRYCPDEAICWPSQALLADDLEISRQRVVRGIRELLDKGWITIAEKRRSSVSGWLHNVYELMEPPITAVSSLAMRTITRRSHSRTRMRNAATQFVSAHRQCRCDHCRLDLAKIRRPPDPVRPRGTFWERLRSRYGAVMVRRDEFGQGRLA